MAQSLKEKLPAKPNSGLRTTSHGRGGAGNINAKPSSAIDPADLQTPTLKSQHYTTGRGGQGKRNSRPCRVDSPLCLVLICRLVGNMAANENAASARAAQDVDAPAHHENEANGTFHWGRGGQGNMMTVGKGDAARTKSKERKGSKSPPAGGERRGSFKGAIERGREMLGLGKSKQEAGRGGSVAVEE